MTQFLVLNFARSYKLIGYQVVYRVKSQCFYANLKLLNWKIFFLFMFLMEFLKDEFWPHFIFPDDVIHIRTPSKLEFML